MKEIKSRILELRRLIIEHNHNYYDLDTNLISDFEYDKLFHELVNLEKEYPQFFDPESPSHRVGGGLSNSNLQGSNSLLDICWKLLKPGGRLVAHAVTFETEQQLFSWHKKNIH